MLGGTFELGEDGSTNLPVRIFQLNHNFCNSMTAKLTAALEEWWRSECSRAEIDILAEITRFYHGNLWKEERSIIVHHSHALPNQIKQNN